jgi:hypothetical protein
LISVCRYLWSLLAVMLRLRSRNSSARRQFQSRISVRCNERHTNHL